MSIRPNYFLVFALIASAGIARGGESGKKAVNGKIYELVRGSFTQQEAWNIARQKGGIPVVFETMAEHRAVVRAFKLGTSSNDICHTGHHQKPQGKEPMGSWETYGKGPSAKLCDLFNSNGPDDGQKPKWGFCINCNGSIAEFSYGGLSGKNEDAGVIWKDNNGLLEDVSVNHRANVLIEY